MSTSDRPDRRNEGVGKQKLRNGSCELLFGDGAVEYALYGRPSVSYGKWRVVGVSHEVVDELFGVVSNAASRLQDERNWVDVWAPIKLDLLCFLGHVTEDARLRPVRLRPIQAFSS